MRHRRSSTGFTLVEVLVAIIILLFGVIVALRIFPRGFEAFTESQQTTTSYKLMDAWVRQFQENPNPPDGIFPLDTGSADATAAAVTYDFTDISAVAYAAESSAVAFNWYHQHLYPMVRRDLSGNVVRDALDGSPLVTAKWPLMQPASARIPRRIEGEKVPIPSARSADVIEEVLATVTADAAQGTSVLQVDDPAKLQHGMWLAVDDPPGGNAKIDLLVQIAFDAANPIGSAQAGNPTIRGALPRQVSTGALLRQFAPASFVPKYLPRFGPILPNGTLQILTRKYAWATDTIDATAVPPVVLPAPVTLYDIRYRRVNRDELERLRDRLSALPDSYYYTLGRSASIRDVTLNDKIVLLPDDRERYVRISCFLQTGPTTTDFVPPMTLLLPASPPLGNPPVTTPRALKMSDGSTVTVTVTASADSCTLQIAAGSYFVGGSEQINRAFRYFFDNALPPVNPEAIRPDEDPTSSSFPASGDPLYPVKLRTYYTKLGAMPAGYYYFPRMDHDQVAGNAVPGIIYFSPRDRGHTVKLDYTVADWSTLHEDLTLNDEGYVTLALPDPKIVSRPTPPREAKTWGLYAEMRGDNRDAVMALVDTRSDMVYHVITRPNDREHPYGLDPSSGMAVPAQAIAIDFTQANAGRVRVAGVPDGVVWRGQWQNSSGAVPIDYKVNDGVQRDGLPYRCIKDHTSAAVAEPGSGAIWRTNWEFIDNPDWEKLGGNTFRIYYHARRDWTLQLFKAPAVFWMKKPQVDKNSLANLALEWRAASWCRETVTDAGDPTKSVSAGWLGVPGVYEGQSVAVDYYYQITDSDGTVELKRVTGEVHPVPARAAGKPNSLLRLAHAPAANTQVTVRGVSVTVRALWIQPRSGQAAVYETDPAKPGKRLLNERWQAKSVTVTLPAFK
jgi:hypothetical protein